MAGALRGSSPPGIEGEYAAALLDTLVGRERRATAQIERLSKNGQKTSAELAWLNALTLRNTGDWRILKNPSRATLLERLEYFRALGKHQGGLKALDFLGRRPGEPLPDWGRIALGVRSPTVEEGNVFVPTLMNLEMAELATILKASQGRELKPESLVVELNVSPGRSVWPAGSTVPEPRVIDWGTWAAYSQRHVLGALSNTERYLVHCLGALEQGGDFRRETTDHFASLSLFPLLGAVWESRVIPKVGSTPQPGYQDVGRCPAVVAVAQSRPEVITAANWGELASKCWQASRDGSLPGPSAWFQPAVPRGTTFDVRNRYFVADLLKVFNTEIEALVELAPYEPLLVSHLISVKYADKPNPEQFAAAWGRLSEYDANVVQRRLKMVTPDKDAVVELAKKACQSNPDECLGAGDKLRERGFEEAAVAVYERAVALAHDRVAVSNSCRWLVQYYFDHGKTEKAVTVAHMVGAVYSAEGLETLGQVLERMGKYDDAEKVYKALVERYPNTPATLLSFYIRHEHRVADGRFRGQAADAIKQLFPGPWGMRQVTLTDLKKSPFSNTGVSVMWARELQAAGAVPDDTVLAVDGYRVTTQGQYECVMSLADGPEITLLVFRNKAYVEIKGHVDRWHFGPSTEVRAAS
jgi:tetratricopeptide (TPR) repeat protein